MDPTARLNQVLDRATALRSDRSQALRMCHDVLDEADPTWPHVAARAWRVIGHAHLLDDELDEAADAYKASLRRARALSDGGLAAHALCGLGEVAQRRGAPAEALEHFGSALGIAEVDPTFSSIWLIHNHLGNAHADMGEYEDAGRCYERCLTSMGPDVPARKAAVVLGNIGVALASRGELEPSRRYFEQAASRWATCGPSVGEASNLGNLGKLEALLGRPDVGLPMLARSVQMMRELASRTGELEELFKVAEVHQTLEQDHEAIEALTRALLLAGEIDAKRSQVRIGRLLARLHADREQFDRAWAYERAAGRLSDELARSAHKAALLAAEARREAEVAAVRMGELGPLAAELRAAYVTIQNLSDPDRGAASES